MLPSVRFRNVEVEVEAMGEGSDHNSWQQKQVLDILTRSWDKFFVLIPMKPLPPSQAIKIKRTIICQVPYYFYS